MTRAAKVPIPATLLGNLKKLVPGFADEKARDQVSLAQMLWLCTEGNRQHRHWEDMFSFSTEQIRELWGEDVRMRRVVGYRYFTVHQGSNLTETTSGFAPSVHMAEALVRTLLDEEQSEWVDDQGRVWVPAGRAISSMAASSTDNKTNRQSKWKHAEPAKFVPINRDGLAAYRKELDLALSGRRLVARATKWLRRQKRAVMVTEMMGRNPRHSGSFPIKYYEGSTGRINAKGHSLQSMPGMVRSAALAGAWDYDISTCQWTILAQMARRFGIHAPLTDAYIADKKGWRSRVANGADITLDEAKQCITALLFGAIVQKSSKAMWLHPGDLTKLLGIEAALRLSTQGDFMALYAEVRRVGDGIVRAWPRNNGRLFNDLRIQFNSGSELAHLLQGAEAAALRVVVMQQQGNILLCIHDGWVTRDRIDVAETERLIYEATGYDLTIEESQLEPPGRDQIKATIAEFERVSLGELDFQCPFAVAMSPPGEARRSVELVESGDSGESGVSGESARSTFNRIAESCSDPSLADAIALWTSYPFPYEPVASRFCHVSPRPGWNLPPGSTTEHVGKSTRPVAK